MALSAPTGIGSSTDTANSNQSAVTLTDAVALGSTVLLFGGFSLLGRTITGVTDNKGNSYSVDVTVGHASAAYSVGIARSVISTALAIGDVITVTWSGAANVAEKKIFASKVTAALGFERSSTTATGTTTTHAWTSGSMTPNHLDALIFGGSLTNAGFVPHTATNSNTELFEAAAGAAAAVVYRIVTAVGSYAATGSFQSPARSDQACAAVYYEVGANQTVAVGQATETDTAGAISLVPFVRHDTSTQTAEFATATTQSTNHTPVTSTPRGVVVSIIQDGGTEDQVSGVTYGGVAMTRVLKTDALGATLGSVYFYFLGRGIPTGTQSVAITSTGTRAKRSMISTVIADAPTEVLSFNSAAASTNSPSIAFTGDALRPAAVYYALFHNNDSLPTGNLGQTPSGAISLGGNDFGTEIGLWSERDVSGSSTMGWGLTGTVPWTHGVVVVVRAAVVNYVVETDTAGYTVQPKTVAVGRVSETDTAGALTRAVRATPKAIVLRAEQRTQGTSPAFSSPVSITATLPAVRPDDILIAYARVQTVQQGAFTWPAGWTAIDATVDGNGGRQEIRWKRYAAGDTAPTITMPCQAVAGGKNGQVILQAWAGCVTSGSPIDQVSAVDNTGVTGTTATFPTITPTVARSMILMVCGSSSSGTVLSGVSGRDPTPTAFTNLSGTGTTFNIAGGTQRDIAATGARTGTLSNTAVRASLTFNLKPANSDGTFGTFNVEATNAEATATTATQTVTLPADIPADSTAVACFYSHGADPGTLTVTDSAGNTWTVLVRRHGSSTGTIAIASLYLPEGLASGTVITGTWASSISHPRFTTIGWFVGNYEAGATGFNDASGSSLATWTTGATGPVNSEFARVVGARGNANSATSSGQTGAGCTAYEVVDTAVSSRGFAVVWGDVPVHASTAQITANNSVNTSNLSAIASFLPKRTPGAVGRATETDTAGAITARKTKAIGQASDTETAGVVTPVLTPSGGTQEIPVLLASETDTAGAVTRLILGRATETDTAPPVTARKTRAIGQATETDTARPVVDAVATGQASETDTASRLSVPLGRATETDRAARLAVPLGQATETDTARPVLDVVLTGRASETDTAGAITVIWFPLVHTALETDTAQIVRRLILEIATETDTAREVVRLILEIATETDTAGAILPVLYLYPDAFDAPEDETLVFMPTLIRGQLLEVDVVPSGSPTVYQPSLIRGTLLEVGVGPTGSPTVYQPTLQRGQQIAPGVGPTGAPVVYQPTIIRGQLLLVGTGPSGSPTVYQPSLIRGQELEVGVGPTGTPTVYQPTLQHAQSLEVGVGPTGSPTVYSPSLAGSQFLVVGDLAELDEATVFEPSLHQRTPSSVVVGGGEQLVRGLIRTAR